MSFFWTARSCYIDKKSSLAAASGTMYKATPIQGFGSTPSLSDLPQDRPICSSDPQEAQLTQSSNYEHMFKIQIIIRHSKSLPLHFYLFLQKSTTTLPPSDWGLELHHFLCRDTSVQFLDLVWPGSSFTVQQTTEHQQHMYKQYTRCLPILYSI